jgi:hypothetical protein
MQPLAFLLATTFNPIISCTDEEAIPRYTHQTVRVTELRRVKSGKKKAVSWVRMLEDRGSSSPVKKSLLSDRSV